MLLFPESGPKKNSRVNGFTKTVTLHIRSIGPNTEVGPPERTRQTVREGLNDVFE